MTTDLQTLPEAIARQEGFYVQGSRACRNANPGNLDFEPWMTGFGAVLETVPPGRKEEPRFASFPSAAQGFAAMCELLRRAYVGLTLSQLIDKWAPSTDNNDDQTYLRAVSEWTGIAPTTIITAEMAATPGAVVTK